MRNDILLAIAAALVVSGCGSCSDDTASNDATNSASNNTATNGTDNGASNSATNSTTNSMSNGPTNGTPDNSRFIDQTRDEYCMGEGPPIIVGDQGAGLEAVCTGDLAQTTFRFGLCVCEDFSIGNVIRTDSFDSDVDPNAFNDKGGAVGINGSMNVGNSGDIGGSLWVAGPDGLEVLNGLSVGNQLRVDGSVSVTTSLTVAADAYVGGDVSGSSLTVDGTLHIPEEGSIDGINQMIAQTVREPVDVAPPCDCEDTIDIAAFTANHRDNNHNEDIGLDPQVLRDADTSVTIDLPCGVFYIDGGSVVNALTINVTGRTVLFVGGDLGAGNSIRANVDDGAEFDLFVEGNIDVGNSMSIGSEERPASARLYVGGSSVNMVNGGRFAGNLYAPEATVTVGNSIEVFGSMFVREFIGGNGFTIHYDEAVLRAGEDCATGGGSGNNANSGNNGGGMCTECEDCGNQACNDGVCGGCETDTDCCSPLVCIQGECMLYIL